ncbi:MAG: hypothetical protein NTU80_11630 [Verrucomicrobia bacterium]|nr:hypothetical protein [Verrucomicrobiota bacterium]
MRALSRFLPSAPPPSPCLLARGEAFFVRRATLVADEPAAAQLLLAVEGMAPFPPEQLYHGHVLSADGRTALVFAGFRRRFTAEETAEWATAAMVTAEFVPLLAVSGEGDRIVVHASGERISALAWRSGQDLPEAVLVRQGGEDALQAVLQELRARVNFGADVTLQQLTGTLALLPESNGAFEALCEGQSLGSVPAARLVGADVRDPDFLLERRRAEQRDVWLWRGLLGVAALLALSALLDLGAGVFGLYGGKLRAQVVAQTDAVRQTETAQALANRIAELSEKRLMPFEMLAMINPARPDSVVFQRAVTRGLTALEVEAQATNAEDVGSYTNALKALPVLASVKTRVDGVRDGVTRFVLTLDFKPDALRNGGAK